MSRALFSQARTGRRATTSNFTNVDVLEWEVGKSNRVVIPLYTDSEGREGPVLFGQTIHKLDMGVMQLPKKNGGTYSTYVFRCSHPYSQLNFDDAQKIAESEEMCVLCEYERLQNTRRMALMEKEYGTKEKNYEDWGENFKALKNAEKKAFFQEHPISVEKSYYTQEVEDGDDYNVSTTEMYMLVYDIEVEETSRKMRLKSGKTRTIKENQPVKDADGKVKYKPALLKVSQQRLNNFKDAIENELASETISYDNLHTIIENEGTEFEEEVNLGWIDFELKYPAKEGSTARMDSARDMSIHATVDSKSILLNNEGLLEDMQDEIEKDYKAAKSSFDNVYKNLQLYTRKEQLALLSKDARGEFEQLREEYRTKDDEAFEQEIYDKVLNAGKTDKDDVDEEVVEDVEDDTEEVEEIEEKTAKKKAAKKKPATRKTATKKKKPVKKKEEVEEDELDEDIEFDEDELFST